MSHYPKFGNLAREDRPVQQPAGEGPPLSESSAPEDPGDLGEAPDAAEEA
jgi:hypothetical protein